MPLKKQLASLWRIRVSFLLLFLAFVGSMLFVYHNHSFYEDAIVEIVETSLEDRTEVTDGYDNQDIIFTQHLLGELRNGDYKGESIYIVHEYTASGVYHPEFSVGDELFVVIDQPLAGEMLTGGILDVKRDQDLLFLAWVFIFVLLIVGKRQGFLAVISLFVNAVIISYALDVYIHTSNIRLLLMMGIAVILMTILSLLLISGFHERTYAAIVATLLGTFLLLLIAVFVLWLTEEQGLRYEEMAFLTRPPQTVFVAGLLVGSLGAVMDVAVTISSSLFGLYEKNHSISNKDLKSSGMEIGKDIMGTMTNILFFAYVSGTIPSLLLYFMNDAPLGFALSMNLSLELTRALAGGIGIVLTIPIGLYTTIFFVNRKRVKV
ncbi:putative membrane protein [Natronobacillus azotifigens]|uniref:YibE/F family protein n=1 Tax=Natronobacillus azotifigens TaxID=472978 RepID=A0A9J6RDA1_9BACI|nr:YibE/F family protein [Natronobacillus azotifigens]MCZ0703527.1 YibE/F family protein [Natronobacillus azotifigens]